MCCLVEVSEHSVRFSSRMCRAATSYANFAVPPNVALEPVGSSLKFLPHGGQLVPKNGMSLTYHQPCTSESQPKRDWHKFPKALPKLNAPRC